MDRMVRSYLRWSKNFGFYLIWNTKYLTWELAGYNGIRSRRRYDRRLLRRGRRNRTAVVIGAVSLVTDRYPLRPHPFHVGDAGRLNAVTIKHI